MSNVSIKNFVENFEAGMYQSHECKTQCAAGWYDWFCSDNSLANRTIKLGKIVSRLAKSAMIDVDNHYVFFKNICPAAALPTYDAISVCDMKTGNVLYHITPRSSWSKKSEVYSHNDEFENVKVLGTIRDVYKFFGV